MIFQCVCVCVCVCVHLLYPFVCQWTLRLLSCLGYSATMNIRVHVSFQIRGFFFLHMWPRLRLLVVPSLSRVQLFATPWTVALQASLSSTISQSSLKLMSIVLVMPSNHLILCRLLLLLPSIFPSIRVFSNESVLCIRWPKYRSFSFSISPSNEYSGLISFRID